MIEWVRGGKLEWNYLTCRLTMVDLNDCQKFQFCSLGLLMKRASCLWATSRRLSLMVTLVKEIDILIDHSNCASINCREVGMLCYYGTLLQTFIAGWHSAECTQVSLMLLQRSFTVSSVLQAS